MSRPEESFRINVAGDLHDLRAVGAGSPGHGCRRPDHGGDPPAKDERSPMAGRAAGARRADRPVLQLRSGDSPRGGKIVHPFANGDARPLPARGGDGRSAGMGAGRSRRDRATSRGSGVPTRTASCGSTSTGARHPPWRPRSPRSPTARSRPSPPRSAMTPRAGGISTSRSRSRSRSRSPRPRGSNTSRSA